MCRVCQNLLFLCSGGVPALETTVLVGSIPGRVVALQDP